MATVTATGVDYHNFPYLIRGVKLSTITPGAALDITHGGPSGANPLWVQFNMVTEATSQDPVVAIEHYPALDSASGGTARLRVKTTAAGDLTGAVVEVLFFFTDQSAGGIS